MIRFAFALDCAGGKTSVLRRVAEDLPLDGEVARVLGREVGERCALFGTQVQWGGTTLLGIPQHCIKIGDELVEDRHVEA